MIQLRQGSGHREKELDVSGMWTCVSPKHPLHGGGAQVEETSANATPQAAAVADLGGAILLRCTAVSACAKVA